MEEIWKPVVGYEGYYEVSNLGNVRNAIKLNLKTKYFNSQNYFVVNLSKSGISRNRRLHRIIAMAFIPNPENKPQVNHINGIKDDNRVENLEGRITKQ